MAAPCNAFGDIGTTYRELDWKEPVFYGRAVPKLQTHRALSGAQAFSGAYVEPDSDCNPKNNNPAGNSLSPRNGSFIAPWQRTAEPGGTKGGGKFDRPGPPGAFTRPSRSP
jgi:hypothetical protein